MSIIPNKEENDIEMEVISLENTNNNSHYSREEHDVRLRTTLKDETIHSNRAYNVNLDTLYIENELSKRPGCRGRIIRFTIHLMRLLYALFFYMCKGLISIFATAIAFLSTFLRLVEDVKDCWNSDYLIKSLISSIVSGVTALLFVFIIDYTEYTWGQYAGDSMPYKRFLCLSPDPITLSSLIKALVFAIIFAVLVFTTISMVTDCETKLCLEIDKVIRGAIPNIN